jgi:hypothetical protein
VKIGKRVGQGSVQIECDSGNVDRELYAWGLNAVTNHRDTEAQRNSRENEKRDGNYARSTLSVEIKLIH